MRRCLGCMREYDEAFDLCPECGYIAGTPAESAMHLAPGTLLCGRYLLGKVLGQGGFGITYIAWDNKLDRAMAVKEYMPRAYAARAQGDVAVTCYNSEAQQQFRAGLEKVLKETRTLAKFNELESVVHVYDCIEANGTAYIIMELLRGSTVKQFLKENGALSFEQTAQIILPILQTLRQIHRVGLIHRDISPDNIFLCANGTVKLLDFGSARVVTGMDQKELSVVLKPGYAPREQYSARGAQGPWTDLYSVAATMYKMLTGETPVDSLSRSGEDDPLENIGALVRIPEDAAQAIMDALEVDPAKRTQTADALIDVLARYVRDSQTNAPAPSVRIRRPRGKKAIAAIAAVLAVVLVAAGGTVVLSNPQIRERIVASLHTSKESEPEDMPAFAIVTPKDAQAPDEAQLRQARETIETMGADTARFSAAVDPEHPDAAYMQQFVNADGSQLLTVRYGTEGKAIDAQMIRKNSAGNVLSDVRFQADGTPESVTVCDYDADGRQTAQSWYTNGVRTKCDMYVYAAETLDQVQTFDENGTCIQVETYERNGSRVDQAVQRDTNGAVLGYVAYHYNKDGSVSEEREFNARGKQMRLRTFDAQGQTTAERFFDENGNRLHETECEYNASDRRLEKVKLYEDGAITQTTVYHYNADGLPVKTVRTDRDGAALSALEYTYDEDGKLDSVSAFDADNHLRHEQHTDGSYTHYEYPDGYLKYVESVDAKGEKTGYEKIDSDSKGRPERREIYEIADGKEKLTGYVLYEYNGSAHSESVYTDKDKLTERIFYTDENILFKRELYEGEDKLIEDIEYDNDGEPTERHVWEYNSSGQEISFKSYTYSDGEEQLIHRTEWDYHSNGEIRSERDWENGVLVSEEKHDESGNLTYNKYAETALDQNNKPIPAGSHEVIYKDNDQREEIEYDKNGNVTQHKLYWTDLFGNERSRDVR